MKLIVWGVALALASSPVVAGRAYGDWTVTETDFGSIAETANESGASLGKMCTTSNQTCLWILLDSTTCVDGESTPAIVSSAAGAGHVTLTCSVTKMGKLWLISPYEPVGEAINVSGRIGIAIPLENGQFQVVRFSLTGSSTAVQAAEAIVTSKAATTTRDQTL